MKLVLPNTSLIVKRYAARLTTCRGLFKKIVGRGARENSAYEGRIELFEIALVLVRLDQVA
jgi:hypothetical protein